MHPIPSKISRPGIQFSPLAERALYPDVESAAISLNSDITAFLSEMPGPLGVPDFTVLYGGKDELMRRLDSSIPPITTQFSVAVLSALHIHRPIVLETVSNRLDNPSFSVERELKFLEEKGAVRRCGDHMWVRDPLFIPFGTIIAYEAKLRDWQRAAVQGRRYRTWADNAVLVLGELSTLNTENAFTQATNFGTGLVIDGVWKKRPMKRTPPLSARLLAREFLIAALRG